MVKVEQAGSAVFAASSSAIPKERATTPTTLTPQSIETSVQPETKVSEEQEAPNPAVQSAQALHYGDASKARVTGKTVRISAPIRAQTLSPTTKFPSSLAITLIRHIQLAVLMTTTGMSSKRCRIGLCR